LFGKRGSRGGQLLGGHGGLGLSNEVLFKNLIKLVLSIYRAGLDLTRGRPILEKDFLIKDAKK